MSFIDGNNSMFMPVAPAYGGGGGFESNSMWWFIILILAMNGGWGNGWNNNTVPYVMGNQTGNEVQRGFDQQSVMSGLNTIQQGLCNVNTNMSSGFAAQEANNNARQIAQMQTDFAMQTAIGQGFAGVGLGMAQLGAQIAAENCDDRNTINNGVRDILVGSNNNTQRIIDTDNANFRTLYDKLNTMEQNNIVRDYENRIALLQQALDAERQNNQNARFDASQNNQTATIQAGQRTLANEIEQYVAPSPRPAYIVANPNCCPNQYNGACGY